MFLVREVGPEPGQCCATEAGELREAVEKDGTGNCRKVKEDEDGDEAIVASKQEVISEFDEGDLSAMVGSETRLEGFEELIVGHLMLKLGSHCSFQDFAEEGRLEI